MDVFAFIGHTLFLLWEANEKRIASIDYGSAGLRNVNVFHKMQKAQRGDAQTCRPGQAGSGAARLAEL
jgi:hypothetical protein